MKIAPTFVAPTAVGPFSIATTAKTPAPKEPLPEPIEQAESEKEQGFVSSGKVWEVKKDILADLRKKEEPPKLTYSPGIFYSTGGDLARIAQAHSPQSVQWVMMDIRQRMGKMKTSALESGNENKMRQVMQKMSKVLSAGRVKIRALNKEDAQQATVRRAQTKAQQERRLQERAQRQAEAQEEGLRQTKRRRRAGEYRRVGLADGAYVKGEWLRDGKPLPGCEPLAGTAGQGDVLPTPTVPSVVAPVAPVAAAPISTGATLPDPAAAMVTPTVDVRV